MDGMPFYFRKTVDRAIDKLIHKQYPEDEFVLDDDVVIVLTKVDIRVNNPAGETDQSDDSDEDFGQFYDVHDYDHDSIDFESDIEDFIDDRPEEELIADSADDGEYEGVEEEGIEYDSDTSIESVSNDNENDEESQNESEAIDNGSSDNSVSDSDDVTHYVSPRKAINRFSDDESSSDDEESNATTVDDKSETKSKNDENVEEHDRNNDNETKNSHAIRKDSTDTDDTHYDDTDNECIIPRKRLKFNDTSESESSSDEEDNSSEQNANGDVESTTHGRPVYQKDVNKFGVYLLPKIYTKRTRLQYHGRIGMKGIKGYCRPKVTKKQFCDFIARKRIRDGHTRMNLLFVNARHMENRKRNQESELPNAVRKLLIHLIDQWFPIGIPEERHLNRAIDLLEKLRKRIENGQIPKLKHSNKFYEFIPHQGNERRRPRFTSVKLCDSKIAFVQRMQSAVDCFTKSKNENPLDYFLNEWLYTDLRIVESHEIEYGILNDVIMNTQHINSSRPFGIANIFRIHDLPRKEGNDFSTNITTNHRYLFHFTFASNIACILREGLLVAPRHIHSVNRFLGDGIYFWDAIANAGLNYKSLNIVYVLVCRVALGTVQEVEQQYLDHDQELQWNEGSDSIFCAGKQFTQARNDERDLNEAKIYCGQLPEKDVENPWDRYSLYNEYIVRDKNQVQVEYLIKLELTDDDS